MATKGIAGRRLRLLAGALASALSVVLAGLAAPTAAQVYSFATNPQGALTYTAGAAVAKVVTDKLKMQMRIQPMAGSSTFVPLIDSGEVEFGIVNVEETMAAVAGTRSFAGKPNPNMRVVVVLFQIPLTVIVPADSPIKSLRDLKGSRMASGYVAQLTVQYLSEALLASVGLKFADMRQVPVLNAVQGVDALASGKVDATLIPPGVAQVQQAHIDLSSRGGIRFVPIDTSPEALAILRKYVPMRVTVIQPAPHYPGVIAPTPMFSYSSYIVAHARVPDDVIYRVVQMMHESRDDLVKATPVLRSFDPKAMAEAVDAPWHPGAIKFYSEISQWPPKG
jgi:TRAP transporter TAXI family solute receptor